MSDCKMISCKLNRERKENHKKLDQIFLTDLVQALQDWLRIVSGTV